MLSCEFCEISKTIFSYRLHPVAASVLLKKKKFKANKRIDKGNSLKSGLSPGTPRPETGDPETRGSGTRDPETWDTETLELGPWALGLVTLGHGILTARALVMGPCD